MILSVRDLPDSAAARASDGLVDHVDSITAAPADASLAAQRAAVTLLDVVSAARLAHARYAAARASLAEADAQHEQKLSAAQGLERRADAAFALMRGQVALAAKAGTEGASALDAYLFPRGSRPVTVLYGRAQVTAYLDWLARAASATATGSPAYAIIAAAVEEFRALVAAFNTAIQEKETCAAAQVAARTARNQARAAWNDDISELIESVARVHGEDSDAFRSWIKPLLAIRAAQQAARTREANAEAPADPTGEGGEGSG